MKADLVLIRLIFTAILVGAGYLLRPLPGHPAVSAAAGLLVAAAIILFEMRIQRASLKTLIGAAVGSILGIIGAYLIGSLVTSLNPRSISPERQTFLVLALTFLMAYIGLVVGAAKGEFLELSAMGGIFSELQQVADSPDSSKRQRGRRGLDMLNRLQSNNTLDIQIVDNDFPAVREVDLKLLELSKQLGAVVVTNDFNLNKVAQLHGVAVLNINELANALKPVVLPGEQMRVFILKEGKEYNQGVAYLDDGTMVVVDNARRMIGRSADIAVTSVLQTTAGKMIFGRLWDEAHENGGNIHTTDTRGINTGARRPYRDSRPPAPQSAPPSQPP